MTNRKLRRSPGCPNWLIPNSREWKEHIDYLYLGPEEYRDMGIRGQCVSREEAIREMMERRYAWMTSTAPGQMYPNPHAMLAKLKRLAISSGFIAGSDKEELRNNWDAALIGIFGCIPTEEELYRESSLGRISAEIEIFQQIHHKK